MTLEINIDVGKIVEALRNDSDISAITTNIYHWKDREDPTWISVYMFASPIVHERVYNRASLQCICVWNDRDVTWRTLNDLRLKINDVLKWNRKNFFWFKAYQITQNWWPWEIYDEKWKKIIHKNFDVSYLR